MRFEKQQEYRDYVNNKLRQLDEYYRKYQLYGESGEYYNSVRSALENEIQEQEVMEDIRVIRNDEGIHGVLKNLGGTEIVVFVY